MRGNIDGVSAEGVVYGWCWNENVPHERAAVCIAVDGVNGAQFVAALYRDDLESAGIGDGRHAFRHVLPIDQIEANRRHLISIIDPATGAVIGSVYEYHSRAMILIDDRLSTLEGRGALMEGYVNALLTPEISQIRAAEVFAIIGTFFERLSQDIARGRPLKSERQLGDSIRALNKAYKQISFSPKQTPIVSIVVVADHPFNQIYECLNSLKTASLKVDSRITVLDTGKFEEVALLPSVVRGARYIRTTDLVVPEWLDAVREDNCPFLMFMSGQVMAERDFLESPIEWFESYPRAGAVGGCQALSGAGLGRGGFCLFDNKLEDCGEAGHCDERVDTKICHPVHAFSYQAGFVRRAAFQAVGGLDPIFGDDLGAGVIDLCFRLREAGWSVVSEPRAKVSPAAGAVEAWMPQSLSTPSPAGDLIVQRWLNPSTTRKYPLVEGVATIVAQPGRFRDELEAVRHLREAGYAVAYIGEAESIKEGDVKVLINAGATIGSKIDERGKGAPSLIFLATKEEGSSNVSTALKNTKVLIGLRELRHSLHSNLMNFVA